MKLPVVWTIYFSLAVRSKGISHLFIFISFETILLFCHCNKVIVEKEPNKVITAQEEEVLSRTQPPIE